MCLSIFGTENYGNPICMAKRQTLFEWKWYSTLKKKHLDCVWEIFTFE